VKINQMEYGFYLMSIWDGSCAESVFYYNGEAYIKDNYLGSNGSYFIKNENNTDLDETGDDRFR